MVDKAGAVSAASQQSDDNVYSCRHTNAKVNMLYVGLWSNVIFAQAIIAPNALNATSSYVMAALSSTLLKRDTGMS